MKTINPISFAVLIIVFFIQTNRVQAEEAPFQLSFPVACELDNDCWMVNYVDVQPLENNAKDYTCGPRSYDGHKGTDIAVRDWKAMEQGVDVLAAAEGKVLRIRDSVNDVVLNRQQLDKVKQANKSCGNGVFIEHGNGWQTIYCHLKKNSVVVKPGQTVKKGQKLGQVGHSGYVEFPHLHLSVLKDNRVIDPFTGVNNQHGCNKSQYSLWSEEKLKSYRPFSIYAIGFHDAVPKFERIKKDTSSPDELPNNISALTFWISVFGVQKGDQITMKIIDPEKKVFAEKKMIQEKTRARQFLFIGKKNKTQSFIKGNYKGLVTLKRKLEKDKFLEEKKEIQLILN